MPICDILNTHYYSCLSNKRPESFINFSEKRFMGRPYLRGVVYLFWTKFFFSSTAIYSRLFFCADFRLAQVVETTGPLSFSAIFLSFWAKSLSFWQKYQGFYKNFEFSRNSLAIFAKIQITWKKHIVCIFCSWFLLKMSKFLYF